MYRLSPLYLTIALFSTCLFCACGDDDGDGGGMPTPPPPPAAVDPTEGLTLGNLALPDDAYLPPTGIAWEPLGSHTNEFDYAGKADPAFTEHFRDVYHNGWLGPGNGEWTSNNSRVEDGMLILKATRKPGTQDVHLGVVTSKEPVKYPVYTELRGQVANQVLSSNFWFLSEDDKRELDVLEVYGSDREDHSWFAARASTNYHVFVRNPQTNAIIEDANEQDHHTLPGNEPWRNDFHRYGMYWQDAWTVDFYYDGQLVSRLRRTTTDGAIAINDPDGDVGLDREMFLIMDLESHDWRVNLGHVPTDEELADATKNEFRIDYVRTYRPGAAFDGGLVENGSFDFPALDNWYRDGDVSVSTDLAGNYDGQLYSLSLGNGATVIQPLTVTPGTTYTVTYQVKASGSGARVSLFDGATKVVTGTGDWAEGSLDFTAGEDQTVAYLQLENSGSGVVGFDAISVR